MGFLTDIKKNIDSFNTDIIGKGIDLGVDSIGNAIEGIGTFANDTFNKTDEERNTPEYEEAKNKSHEWGDWWRNLTKPEDFTTPVSIVEDLGIGAAGAALAPITGGASVPISAGILGAKSLGEHGDDIEALATGKDQYNNQLSDQDKLNKLGDTTIDATLSIGVPVIGKGIGKISKALLKPLKINPTSITRPIFDNKAFQNIANSYIEKGTIPSRNVKSNLDPWLRIDNIESVAKNNGIDVVDYYGHIFDKPKSTMTPFQKSIEDKYLEYAPKVREITYNLPTYKELISEPFVDSSPVSDRTRDIFDNLYKKIGPVLGKPILSFNKDNNG